VSIALHVNTFYYRRKHLRNDSFSICLCMCKKSSVNFKVKFQNASHKLILCVRHLSSIVEGTEVAES